VSAAEFEQNSGLQGAERQGLNALLTRGSSMESGPKSLVGGVTPRILAHIRGPGLPGELQALEPRWVTIGPGDDRFAGSNPGSEPLETASKVTLEFMLAGLALSLGSQVERPTLLLVESDEGTRDTLTVMLFAEGYEVVAVANGRDAWNVLRSPFAPIRMMLLDVHLPDISGLHLVQRLRQTYPTLPVFAWMYGSEPTDIAQLSELGVYHYTPVQSVVMTELFESVRAFLHGACHPLE
jgi:CheY-like chemotaxis protein